MYTVNKGPSKIVAKTRRGLLQNYEKYETIKESSNRRGGASSIDALKSTEDQQHLNNIPRPVFQQNSSAKRNTTPKPIEEQTITPQHEEIIRYINDSWNILVAQNPYDAKEVKADANNNNAAATVAPITNGLASSLSTATATATTASTSSPAVWIEPPSPVLNDFQPFDLESWWGRRLFLNITKSL